jgi:NAD(P)H-dependent FMN reductase
MSRPKILVFAGSTRKESFNRKLAAVAALSLTQAGAEATHVELSDYPMPLFNQDEEAVSGLPEGAKRLQDLFLEHDGLLLACPEYNSSITPLLKNTIDWLSRAHGERRGLAAFQGKVAVLVAASAGALGGLRGLRHVREILGNIGVTVLPGQLALSKADSAFTPDGAMSDDKQRASLDNVTKPMVDLLSQIKG